MRLSGRWKLIVLPTLRREQEITRGVRNYITLVRNARKRNPIPLPSIQSVLLLLFPLKGIGLNQEPDILKTYQQGASLHPADHGFRLCLPEIDFGYNSHASFTFSKV
jgi:hypothetical protein